MKQHEYTTELKNGWKLNILFCHIVDDKFEDERPETFYNDEQLKKIHATFHTIINDFGIYPVKGDKVSNEDDFCHVFERDFSTEDKTLYYLLDN